MLKTSDLFDLTHTLAADLLERTEYPWEALGGIKQFIIEIGQTLPADEYEEVSEQVWIARDAKIYPNNYIAADIISGKRSHSYTNQEKDTFISHIDGITKEYPEELRDILLRIYANPVLKA
jgi:hypothetical protein